MVSTGLAVEADRRDAVPGSTRGLTIGRPAVMRQGKTAADFARTKLILRWPGVRPIWRWL